LIRKELILQHGRQFGTFLGLIFLCIILWILTPYFLTVSNLLNILEQSSINAIIAVGMTFVIITAGIDLSVGSMLAFSGVVMASALQAGIPVPLAIFIGLLTGATCGLVNGSLISMGRLPPFIVTLGMMSVARGAALVYTDGRPISGFDLSFRWLATGEIFLIPMPLIIMVLVYGIAHILLTRTKFGRYTYAIGGNEEAAFVLSGLTTGIAALLLTARLNSAQPIAGIMYELDAIAATVIGGTSLMGGEGTLVGTLIGALIMGVLRNGLNILGVSSFLQQIIIGSVIIIAVLLDTMLKKQKR
jgi:ribose/xylose/arabinose/galactoside ABC-type transport system permease subunit